VSVVSQVVLSLSLVLGPLCAAALNLVPGRKVGLLLLLGVFVSGGAIVGLAQSLRLGLGLTATGLVACALLGLGFRRSGWTTPAEAGVAERAGRAFRGATVLLIAAAVWGVVLTQTTAMGAVPAPRLRSAVMILALGLLQLGLNQEQGAAALGLLTVLVGFEVWYTALEPSLALRVVLAAIMVGIALVSSVLLESHADPAPERRIG
jgi:hypothetical protein